MSYNETIEYLFGLQWHGIKLGLDNPRELLMRLGNPEKDGPRFAHAAGTNGKGSTCAMLSSMLMASGLRTGLFTSPHLVSFTERMKVDGMEITEDGVVSLAEEVMSKAKGMKPTFFEAVVAMAFMHFRQKAAEVVVMETGMGGRLDATNVITPEVVMLTPIGLDHAEFLGESLSEVAAEKAGIIKPGVPVVCAAQEPEAMKVIQDRAEELGAALHKEGREFGAGNIERDSGGVTFDYFCDSEVIKQLRIPLRGEYQARNAALAIRAYELMTGGLDEDIIRKGLLAASWPGRLELVANDPPTYVDGAHNPAAADSLAQELLADGMGGKMAVVIGVMSDKDARGIIKPLLPLAKKLIFTRAAYGRASTPEALAGMARELGHEGVIKEVASVADAVSEARATGYPVLVAGSFYSAGEALEALGAKSVLGSLRESAPVCGSGGVQ